MNQDLRPLKINQAKKAAYGDCRRAGVFGIGGDAGSDGAGGQYRLFPVAQRYCRNPPAPGEAIRIGGLVRNGSVTRDGLDVQFAVTDLAHDVTIAYRGMLPDLFREGQGVVVEGRFGAQGNFVADTVLAKHDETYMPPEVADALKAAGKYNPETTPIMRPMLTRII